MGRRDRVWTLALILLIASGLAGCIDGTDDPGEDEEDGAENEEVESLDWWLSECGVVVAVIPVDAETLAGHLPDGFEPVSGEQAFGLPPDPRGEGALSLEAFHCGSGSGMDDELQDFDYGAVFAPVTAPGNLTDPDADIVFYKWETLVQDAPRRELLQDRGLPAVDGETDLTTFETTPGGHLFDVSLRLADATFQITGSAAAPNEEFRQGFHFQELQQGHDGFGQWISTENEANEGNSGTGIVELDPDHWTADVISTQYSQAYVVASPEVNFLEGKIRLPDA